MSRPALKGLVMGPMEHLSWRKWPYVAAILSAAFIVYGITLVSRSHDLQRDIDKEVRLLKELSELDNAIHHLGLVHRVDASTEQYQWPDALEQVRRMLRRTVRDHDDQKVIPAMADELERVLVLADSMHFEVMAQRTADTDTRNADAILNIMLQRAGKTVDRSVREVHETGLGAHTSMLTAQWDEAQVLLAAACLLAVVCAWLVTVSNKLLAKARVRSEELDQARRALERTNKELRETMLSKEEKEVMLKEIHHRVKNNLQIVKSLIRFQMEQVKDPHTTELFNECVNRVSAMALVHEQTYLSKDLANIDVSSYISHLTRDLCHAYTIDTKLDLDIEVNIPTMGVDTLIPLGLLINEIISNALKYAFTGRRTGRVIMHLNTDANGGLDLRIGDDGIGLPDRSRWERPQSLGMELIQTLAGQLDATVTLLDGPGTVYEIVSVGSERRKRA
jgi:two-component sensor histidine kinase